MRGLAATLTLSACSVTVGSPAEADAKVSRCATAGEQVPNVLGAEWTGSDLACFAETNWGNKDVEPSPISESLHTDDLAFTEHGEGIASADAFHDGFDTALAMWSDQVAAALVALVHNDNDRFRRDGPNVIRMVDGMHPDATATGSAGADTTCETKLGTTSAYLDQPYSYACEVVIYSRYHDPDLGRDTYVNWSMADSESAIPTYSFHFPTVLAHELGHVLGLHEWPEDPTALMYPGTDWGTILNVTPDEAQAVEFIYTK